MADIRALLAQERQSRRVSHPHAIYTKSGVLSCVACQLPIRSEALWEGHLRSANHRRNAQRSQQQDGPPSKTTAKSLKRKIEDVDTDTTVSNGQQIDTEDTNNDRGYEVDNRKKPKATKSSDDDGEETDRIPPNGSSDNSHAVEPYTRPLDGGVSTQTTKRTTAAKGKTVRFKVDEPTESPLQPISSIDEKDINHTSNTNLTTPPATNPADDIDEDEWAAFEREIAPLSHIQQQQQQQTADHPYPPTATVISAAPISAAQLQAETEAARKRLRDVEGDEEKEDEGRRMEEEFDVMEEMEGRVRRLREKREALRSLGLNETATTITADGQDVVMPDEPVDGDGGGDSGGVTEAVKAQMDLPEEMDEEEGDEEDDADDDWYS